MVDKANLTMIAGGSVSIVSANSYKMKDSVNLLYYPLWGNDEVYITLSTVISVIGLVAALFGVYRAIKNKK